MQTMRRMLFAVLLVLAVLLLPGCTSDEGFATPGFSITDYNITAVISEDNVYDITEVIHVTFEEGRHGIYRTIPVNTAFVREAADGAVTSRLVGSSVSDIAVKDWDYHTKSSGQQVTIYFGDSDKLVHGQQTYSFSYKMRFTTDGTLGFDEVYYNIVGFDWPVPIEKVNFSVTLPKAFDADKLGFSIGYPNTSGYNPDDLSISVDGNTIRGTVLRELNAGQAVTMRVELPAGYFRPNDVRKPDWIVMGCMGLLVIIAWLIHLIYGRDRKPVKTVEFYPPDGMTPAEVGYVYDGVADPRDLASMLIYWADKGYLSIRTTGDDYELTKLKELDEDAKPFEKEMFQSLFFLSNTTNPAQSKLFMTLVNTQASIASSFEKDFTPFTKKSLRLQWLLSLLAWLPLCVTLMMTFWAETMDESWIFGVIMGIMSSVAMMLPLLFTIHLLRYWNSRRRRWLKLICFLALFAGLYVFYMIVAAPTFLEPLRPVAAAVSALLIVPASAFIKKRSEESRRLMGRILGFKDFIVLAEKDRIQELVQENPDYFYRILPYAYVLDVTDKWIKHFEGFLGAPPAWFQDAADFSPALFMHHMNNAMASFQYSMMPASSSDSSSGSSSSGSSGGSFSGGGGGGGGGGAW